MPRSDLKQTLFKRAKRFTVFGLSLLVLSLLLILSGVWLTPACKNLRAAITGGPQFDVAIILGAGMEPDGRLHKSALGRVEAGVTLYQNSVTHRLHSTGGTSGPNGPAAGAQMAKYAHSLGVPQAQISHEDRSQSTLQNALFSKPYVDNFTQIILVSEGFHLIRSWLSFRWAGIPVTGLCHSTGLRKSSADGNTSAAWMLTHEVLAFWFNLGRAALWSALNAFGFRGPQIDGLLY